MKKLGDSNFIRCNILNAKLKTILLFHKLVFEDEGNRNRRKRLQEFTGFDFTVDSEEYYNKIEWIIENLKLNELCTICSLLGVDCEGTSEEISEKLLNNLIDINLLKEDEDNEYEEEDEEVEVVEANSDRDCDEEEELKSCRSGKSSNNLCASKYRCSMTSKDVQDSIRTFNGEDNFVIEVWLEEFEEIANIMNWNDLEKFVYARKSLKGLAALCVQSERKLVSYKRLKSVLLEEFSHKINSAELHEMLCKKHMKKEETVLQYYLSMKELASRGNIEDDALIKYIVDGIPDSAQNKFTLYESQNLKQLKSKLIIYEKVKSKFTKTVSVENKVNSFKSSTEVVKRTPMRCFNCNQEGHVASVCSRPKRERGSCFKCGKMGHTQKECKESSSGMKPNESTYLIEEETETLPPYTTIIKVENCKRDDEVVAIVDSGSGISLVTSDLVNSYQLEPVNNNRFEGINKTKLNILGKFSTDILIKQCQVKLNITFYVVDNNTIPYQCLLGRDFISCPKLNINFSNVVNICSSELEVSDVNETENVISSLMLIDEVIHEQEILVNQNLSLKDKETVSTIVKSNLNCKKPSEPVENLEVEITLIKDHKPLYNLIKKSSVFNLNADALNAFNTLKNYLISTPTLAIYSPSAETEVHCDASSLGFGSVLLQRQEDGKFHPVSYFSKRTTEVESNYHSFELECLCIIYTLKRFHTYLYGLPFKLFTDCNSLKLALGKKDINPRIARWALFLQNYSFTVTHRPAKRMEHVDALSRNHGSLILEENTFEQNLLIHQTQIVVSM